MKRFILLLMMICFAVNVSAVWSDAATRKFIYEMQKASDPGNVGRNIKTLQMTADTTVLKLNIKIQSKSYFKFPDKIRYETNVAAMQNSTIYFDGSKGFKVDSLAGVMPLEGLMLEEYKLAGKMSNPAITLDKIFDKIEIADAPELYKGKKYIALTGSFTPDKKIPQWKILVDPKTKLPVYIFRKVISEMGMIDSITHNIGFKKMNGLIVPVHIVQDTMNMQLETRVKTFIVNKKIVDSFFEYKE